MTKSGLRAVLGCHSEYLKNMGVAGTLVIPVVVSDTYMESHSEPYLWGLVVCHSSVPHFVP
jgi:light-regulated signal transduction histidine kinase (bacteriophytochrome)